jgi:hypothetical protein
MAAMPIPMYVPTPPPDEGAASADVEDDDAVSAVVVELPCASGPADGAPGPIDGPGPGPIGACVGDGPIDVSDPGPIGPCVGDVPIAPPG